MNDYALSSNVTTVDIVEMLHGFSHTVAGNHVRDQVVQVGDAQIPIARDEAITTEYSHKYTLEEFGDMVAAAGFSTERVWTDPRGWFSVHYCTRP